MISGDLSYVEKESLGKLKGEIGDIERMLKALIKSLESKQLNLRLLEPFLQANWEKCQKNEIRVDVFYELI